MQHTGRAVGGSSAFAKTRFSASFPYCLGTVRAGQCGNDQLAGMLAAASVNQSGNVVQTRADLSVMPDQDEDSPLAFDPSSTLLCCIPARCYSGNVFVPFTWNVPVAAGAPVFGWPPPIDTE
jgi:hypothetical protein